jgi:N-acetylmuramoyl-L-alanine amidase
MTITPRARWGARHRAGFGPAPAADELWLHHSATRSPGLGATFEQDAATVRQLEDIGQQRFGGGISYTFAVTESGRVFEGTGPMRVGSHTGGRNTRSRGLVLIGNYERARPTDPQLTAVAELIRHGNRVGWWRTDRLNGGHRDAPKAATACPGNAAWPLIPVINSRALGIVEDDDMDDEQDARLRRVEAGLTTVLQQLAGPGATLEQPWPGEAKGSGWPHRRYNHDQPARLTLVDYLREIDRQLNSGLDLENRPSQGLDDAWGHVLSMRAEVFTELQEIRAMIEQATRGAQP